LLVLSSGLKIVTYSFWVFSLIIWSSFIAFKVKATVV
jgi:hypothetical protein